MLRVCRKRVERNSVALIASGRRQRGSTELSAMAVSLGFCVPRRRIPLLLRQRWDVARKDNGVEPLPVCATSAGVSLTPRQRRRRGAASVCGVGARHESRDSVVHEPRQAARPEGGANCLRISEGLNLPTVLRPDQATRNGRSHWPDQPPSSSFEAKLEVAPSQSSVTRIALPPHRPLLQPGSRLPAAAQTTTRPAAT